MLTENEGDRSALPSTQHHEGMGQPLAERGAMEAVVTVVGVVANWRGVRILCVLQGDGDGHDMHLPVVRDRRKGHGRDILDGHQLGMTEVVMVFDSRISIDLFETEQLPETIGEVRRGVAHGVARAATSVDGRNDLDAIQTILAANGGSGRAAEEITSRADLIS
jgi:hypothetical protein